MSEHHPEHNGQHPVEIEIDGDTYIAPDNRETVAEILGLASKSPAEFQLIMIKGKREREPLPDPNQEVKLHKGSAFITVPLGPTPVS
jgi:hypothetical protein